NTVSMLFTLFCILTLMRFYPDVVMRFYPEHINSWGVLDMFICFLLGLFFDVIVTFFYNKITKKRYEILAGTTKIVGLEVTSADDKVEKINGIDYGSVSVRDLSRSDSSFWLKEGLGNTVLC